MFVNSFWHFGMLLKQSAIMHIGNLGQRSLQTVHFWPNLGVSLVLNGVSGWKSRVRFPCQVLWILLMNQFWLWSASAAISSHLNMSFGPNQPWSCLFLANIGGQLGRKCCSWLKMPCTIPIPVVMILVCKPILTLECFCSYLQPYLCVILARIAPELVIFCQIWGSAWQ